MSTENDADSSVPEDAVPTPSEVQQYFDQWGTYLVSQHCKACVDWLAGKSPMSSEREDTVIINEAFKLYMDAILSGRQPRAIVAEALSQLLDCEREDLLRVRFLGRYDDA
jgi:hypothetical protein